MNSTKRATISILRRPVKTLILLLLVFILGTIVTGAISVEGAINNTDANLRQQMRPIVSVDLNWRETADIPFLALPILTPTDVHTIGELSYVAFYEYMILSSLYSFELKNYTGDQMRSWTPGTPDFFDLRGISQVDFIQMEQEMIELVEGREFEENELIPGEYQSVAIISEAFANENNLLVGSIFELYSFVFFPQEDEEFLVWSAELFADENIYARVAVEFEVIGLYDIPIDSERDDMGYRRNRDRVADSGLIYVPNWAIEDVFRRESIAAEAVWDAVDFENPWDGDFEIPSETRVTPVFVLGDPAYLDDFKTAAEPLLPEFHFFDDLSSAFDEIASSMVNLQNIADWILYSSIGATLLILSLVITLFLRDRRHEIGIYLALGEKKGNIITQVLLEIVITSFVGITLAIIVGHFITDIMSQNMLRVELVAQEAERDEFVFEGEWTILDRIGIPTPRMTPDEMMTAFEVSLGIKTIGLFYAVGLGTVALSTLTPVLYIVRLKPKKVLL